jgi:DNA-binding MarR family transcriptional regulator
MDITRRHAQQLLQLFEVMRQGKSGAAFMRVNQLNLSISHLRTLHLLAPDKTLAMKDLAERLQVTPPSITAITRRLVQTGLVQRQCHPEDSRVVLLSLTDEGRQLFHELYEEQLCRMEALLQGLSVDEQRLFIELLERAVQALREAQVREPDTSTGLGQTPMHDQDKEPDDGIRHRRS